MLIVLSHYKENLNCLFEQAQNTVALSVRICSEARVVLPLAITFTALGSVGFRSTKLSTCTEPEQNTQRNTTKNSGAAQSLRFFHKL